VQELYHDERLGLSHSGGQQEDPRSVDADEVVLGMVHHWRHLLLSKATSDNHW
jgi:hypothetical protein